jgi:DNA polymerase
MLVGSFPTRSYVRQGRRFVTRQGTLTAAGTLLQEALQAATRRSLGEVYLTDLVKAAPPPTAGRVPASVVAVCRFHLEHEFAAVRPALVIALGSEVAHALIPGFARVSQDRGKPLLRVDGAYVVATYHPEYAVRFHRQREFKEDIAHAARLLSGTRSV